MNFQQQQKYVDAILPGATRTGCTQIGLHWRVGVPGNQIWVWREKENWVAFNQSEHSYHYSLSLRLAVMSAKENACTEPFIETEKGVCEPVEF